MLASLLFEQDGLLDLVVEKEWGEYLTKLPGVEAPFDPNKSNLAEVILYPVAAIGFYYQLSVGFALPFPLNLIFLPLTLLEFILKWQLTFPDAPTPSG